MTQDKWFCALYTPKNKVSVHMNDSLIKEAHQKGQTILDTSKVCSTYFFLRISMQLFMESHHLMIKNKNNNNIAVTICWMLTMYLCKALHECYLNPCGGFITGSRRGQVGRIWMPDVAAAQGHLASKPNLKARSLDSKPRTAPRGTWTPPCLAVWASQNWCHTCHVTPQFFPSVHLLLWPENLTV